jgi:hypothetical protein
MVEGDSKSRLQEKALGSTFDKRRGAKFHLYKMSIALCEIPKERVQKEKFYPAQNKTAIK